MNVIPDAVIKMVKTFSKEEVKDIDDYFSGYGFLRGLNKGKTLGFEKGYEEGFYRGCAVKEDVDLS